MRFNQMMMALADIRFAPASADSSNDVEHKGRTVHHDCNDHEVMVAWSRCGAMKSKITFNAPKTQTK